MNLFVGGEAGEGGVQLLVDFLGEGMVAEEGSGDEEDLGVLC